MLGQPTSRGHAPDVGVLAGEERFDGVADRVHGIRVFVAGDFVDRFAGVFEQSVIRVHVAGDRFLDGGVELFAFLFGAGAAASGERKGAKEQGSQGLQGLKGSVPFAKTLKAKPP